MNIIMENWRGFVSEQKLPPLTGNPEVYGPIENFPSPEDIAAMFVRILPETQLANYELFEKIGGHLIPPPWNGYFNRMLNSYYKTQHAEFGPEIDVTNKQEIADWILNETGIKVNIENWPDVKAATKRVLTWTKTTPRYAQLKEKWKLP